MCEIFNNGVSVDVFRDTRRRARKDHRCDACGGDIKAGQLYTDHFSVFDGEPNPEKMCSPCEYSMRSFAKGHGRYNPSSLRDCLDECIDYEGADRVWWFVRARSAMSKRWAAAKAARA